jgi:peptide chain release factor 1
MDEAKKYLEVEVAKIEAEIENVGKMLGTELDEEARKEILELGKQKEELEKALLRPAERDSEGCPGESFNSVIMEGRPGVGGDEAKLWADDLVRMYQRYAEFNGFKVEILDDGVIKIKGKNTFDLLKWETGVHRVQRVPETEANGRIHTSTASIVVLPEVPESRIDIKEDDLIWEFTRGGGHGGQNVNKVASAVRLTHKPSGLVINCRQERSQEQNRKVALSMLRSQLWEIEEERKLTALAGQRAAIGRGMRSEKIRTFNYPQNRVTDHRIGVSWHKLDKIIDGDLGDVLAACGSDLGNNNANHDNQTTDNEG